MEITNKKLTNDELRKAGLLIVKASELGIDCSGYGQLDVNYNSGNVYLWLEDYPFTLFIGLWSDHVYVLWSNPENGEEVETAAGVHTLESLLDWCEQLYNEMQA